MACLIERIHVLILDSARRCVISGLLVGKSALHYLLYQNLPPKSSQFGTCRPTKLDKIKKFHSTDSIDTENSGTLGRSIWVHSRLPDSSVPAGEGGGVGNGVAHSLGTEPG